MNSTELSTNNGAQVTTEPSSMISVRVGQLPGKIKTLQVPESDCTVGALLGAAGLSSQGYEIRLDNQPAKLDTPVRNNQTVLLIRPVKGN